MQGHTDADFPVVSRLFDLQEAVILLDVYLSTVKNGETFTKAAEIASERLRTLAKNKGLMISDSYRSAKGLMSRLHSLAGLYEGRNLESNQGTVLFAEAVSLYRNNQARYEEILSTEKKAALKDGERNRTEEQGKKDVTKKNSSAEQAFLQWLSNAVAPTVLKEIQRSYIQINVMLVKSRVLSRPLTDITSIDEVEFALHHVKRVFVNKRLCNLATQLMATYIDYLREKKETNNGPENVSDEADLIKYDFTNSHSFAYTLPVHCSIGGEQVEGKNWVCILVAITEHELANQNSAMERLYEESLVTAKKGRPYLMKERLNNMNCKQLSNGYWICVDYNIPTLMKMIGMLCLRCGYTKEQIVLYGVSKYTVTGAKVTNISDKKRCEKTGSSITTNSKQSENQDGETSFYDWLVKVQGLAKATARNYNAAIPVCNAFCEEHKVGTGRLYDVKSIEELQNNINQLLKDADFQTYNKLRHNQLSAALSRYFEFVKWQKNSGHTVVSYFSSGRSADTEILPVGTTSQIEERRNEFNSIKSQDDHLQRSISEAEDIVLQADMDGISYSELQDKMNITMSETKRVVSSASHIVEIKGKLYHEDSFIDWHDGATQMDSIIEKLMEKNSGYVSAAQLYDYAHAEMHMFLNDNDLDEERAVYEIAEHLFGKNEWGGKHYTFTGKLHISRSSRVKSNFDVVCKYAEDHGGVFRLSDLEEYLSSMGIRLGNLHGQLRIYNDPTFLYYDDGIIIYSKSMGISEEWKGTVKIALNKLFHDVGDHIILRDIQTLWFSQLPELPSGRSWTPLLLQSVLRHYGQELGARTIIAMETQSIDTLHTMLVQNKSHIRNFCDVVIAVLLENEISERTFEAEALRQLLVDFRVIQGNELIWNIPKALGGDERFAWDAGENLVTIRI